MDQIEKAYIEASNLASAHYENFPVISRLLPKRLRRHVAIVYWFSRSADDISDEGNDSPGRRIERLDRFEADFRKCLNNEFAGELWQALKNTIDTFSLKEEYFFDLISAFRQDITKVRYANYEELADYCRRSANPVGRIVLQLSGIRNPECYTYSDYVCTALQLINHYQDISVDYEKGRIYIPLDEMKKFGVEEKAFETKNADEKFKSLMKFQLKRNLELFMKGSRLVEILPYKLKYQISWTIYGGKEILYKIIKLDYDVLNRRPVLSKLDYIILMLKGLAG